MLCGIAGGIRANSYGGDFWSGRSSGISSTGRAAFNGTQQLAAPELETHYQSVRPTYSEASIEFGELKSNAVSYMDIASDYIGLNEANSGSEIYNLFQQPIGLSKSDPWCSGYVNRVYSDVGINGTNSGWARSWLNWGTPAPINNPQYGQLAIFSRGSGGHVGFVIGKEGNYLRILGGNQSDSVNTTLISISRLLGLRWF